MEEPKISLIHGLIYCFEKYEDRYVLHDKDSEVEEFIKKLENLQNRENQLIMNKAVIIYNYFKENILYPAQDSFEYPPDGKLMYKAFHKIFRFKYGVYDKEDFDKYDKEQPYWIAAEELIRQLESLIESLSKTFFTEEELANFIENVDHVQIYKDKKVEK